jgi:hypothetical protein
MSIKPEPHVEDNFFSPEEYGAIYDTVVKTMQRGLDEAGDKYAYMTNVTNNGFFVLNEDEEGKVKFPDSIKEKIRKKMEILVQEPVQPIGLMFARYTHDSSLPSLMPHCDKHHKKQHITVSIQLNKTVDWDFWVEDNVYQTEKNQGVWFSGSHHNHFRPDSNFGPEDYYDIFLCSSQRINDTGEDLTPEWFDKQEENFSIAFDKYKHLFPKGLQKQYEVDGCQ